MKLLKVFYSKKPSALIILGSLGNCCHVSIIYVTESKTSQKYDVRLWRSQQPPLWHEFSSLGKIDIT